MIIFKLILLIFSIGAFIALFCVSSVVDVWRNVTGTGKRTKNAEQQTQSRIHEQPKQNRTKGNVHTDLSEVKDVEYHKVEE